MPVEPGVVDTNVLVYALDADAPQHATSRALLEAARTGQATPYVTSQIFCEFYSVVTNPHRVQNPSSPRGGELLVCAAHIYEMTPTLGHNASSGWFRQIASMIARVSGMSFRGSDPVAIRASSVGPMARARSAPSTVSAAI
jgi:hypothetical protein